MTGGRWETLSSWHNAWLAADAAERDRLRRQLAADNPELLEVADRLTADDRPLQGFLETPALLVAASALAARYAAEGKSTARRRVTKGPAWSIAGALALVLIAGALGLRFLPDPVPARTDAPLVRFMVALPAGFNLLSAPAVSPDGQRIAFVGGNTSGSRVMVRDLGVDRVAVLDGTDGAASPFWSPDSQWIGFSAQGRLMKVARAGGQPIVIDGAVGSWGGAWSSSGVIVFQPAVRNAGLLRVPASGGRSEQASILKDAAGDIAHRFPVTLPDGSSFLYFLASTDEQRRGMHIARLDPRVAAASRRLGTLDRQATHVALADGTGMLLWAADGRIEARSFDPARMRLGDPHAIDIAVAPATENSPAMVAATADVLAYAATSGDGFPHREIGVVIGWRRLVRPLKR